MLGRFVAPAARLNECPASMPVSVLIGPDLGELDRLPSNVDTIELKTAETETAMRRIPAHITPYFEVADPTLIPAGARAKIRTGGITPEAFPSAAVHRAIHRTPAPWYIRPSKRPPACITRCAVIVL